jgi:hypothetical protein
MFRKSLATAAALLGVAFLCLVIPDMDRFSESTNLE